MTENEAKDILEEVKILDDSMYQYNVNYLNALDIAIKALEEIQQYREIEAEIKEQYHANVDIKKLMRCFIETIFKGEKHEGFCILTNDDAKMWEKYRAIGTVEECREARERQKRKKPEHFYKKYGKHQWRRKDNGEIDEDAWDSDTHSGVICEVCGECVCTMCNPDYDELEDCEKEYWICPNCGKKIYCKDEYCRCGQHLDWSHTP